MKLKEGFVLQPIGADVTVLVPVGDASDCFHGVIRLNDTAAFIVEQLKKETDEASLMCAMETVYNGSSDQFADSIHRTLDMLRQVGALIE